METNAIFSHFQTASACVLATFCKWRAFFRSKRFRRYWDNFGNLYWAYFFAFFSICNAEEEMSVSILVTKVVYD